MTKLKHLLVYKRTLFACLSLMASSNAFSVTEDLNTCLLQTESALKRSLYDSAVSYIDQAESMINQSSEPAAHARVLYWSGRTSYALNELVEADLKFEKAISLAILAEDTLLLANCYNDLGRTYKKRAIYSKALYAFNLARQYYYAANNITGVAQVHLNVGNVLKSIDRSELAKKEYWKALAIFKQVGDENNEAGCYNNLGNIYKNEQLFDSAFHYMYLTLSIRERGTSLTTRSYIYHNLANLHLAVQQTDSALFYIKKSFDINTTIQSKTDLASDHNVYGAIYMELKNWRSAILHLDSANFLTKDQPANDLRLDIVKQLGLAHFNAGYKDRAADYFMQFFSLTDSFQTINQNSQVETELIRYELYTDSIKLKQLELERNLELAKQENTALSNTINFRNYSYAIIILLLIISLIAILFISARRRLRQTLAHEAILEVQNQELKRTLISKEEKEILLKEVHHRVKNNLQIINSMIRLQSGFMNAKNFKEKLMETENRIRSMALIHEKLYKTGNLASLSVRNYIEELAINILESYENHNVNIKLKFDLEEREYGIDTLIPLGLIINETLSNSIKHAFYERAEGNIWISIHSKGNISFMTIKDDGIGADLSFDELKEDSLGLELIDSLTEQLDGNLQLNTDHGFQYSFEFKILK